MLSHFNFMCDNLQSSSFVLPSLLRVPTFECWDLSRVSFASRFGSSSRCLCISAWVEAGIINCISRLLCGAVISGGLKRFALRAWRAYDD
jgi:hypothetical protein